MPSFQSFGPLMIPPKLIVMELPFLYRTRTILRSRARELTSRPSSRCVSRSAVCKQESLDGSSFFRRKAAAVAANYAQDAPNTITREEQRAFDNLKRLAGKQELTSRPTIDNGESDQLDVDPDRILALFMPQQSPPTHAPEASPSNQLFDTLSDSTQQPSPLSHDPLPATSPPPAQRTECLARQICTGEIQAYYRAARECLNSSNQPGDLALYTLIEKRVFPLLDTLASQTRSRKSNKQQPKAGTTVNAAGDAQSASNQKSPSPNIQRLILEHLPQASQAAAIPSLTLLTGLYPALLLLSFRLLVKHHPLSPHTHRLLPQIRQLGPSSYILGATTPFYNTYILLRWSIYSSLSELCSLLSEMERGAVEFDRGTARILRDIADERSAELRDCGGEGGSRGKEWWLAPAQQRWWVKMQEWRALIARQLEERGMGEVLREGPDTPADMGSMSGTEAGLPQVWL